jgi:hypothetical protein
LRWRRRARIDFGVDIRIDSGVHQVACCVGKTIDGCIAFVRGIVLIYDDLCVAT